jgi:lysophospholipase L1-like esterase
MGMGKPFLYIAMALLLGQACDKGSAQQPPVANVTRYLLALGDSYTIGQGVAPAERFAQQTVQLLQGDSLSFEAPEIIAQTGWTTLTLQQQLAMAPPSRTRYDAVTLLIGVNNQFQRRPQSEYRTQFTQLLQQAIQYAGNNTQRVTVLSIPDWGVTPFANGYDRALVAAQIDSFNVINRELSAQYRVNYIDITPISRQAATDVGLLAPDGLHPSGRMYGLWAERLRPVVKAGLR